MRRRGNASHWTLGSYGKGSAWPVIASIDSLGSSSRPPRGGRRRASRSARRSSGSALAAPASAATPNRAASITNAAGRTRKRAPRRSDQRAASDPAAAPATLQPTAPAASRPASALAGLAASPTRIAAPAVASVSAAPAAVSPEKRRGGCRRLDRSASRAIPKARTPAVQPRFARGGGGCGCEGVGAAPICSGLRARPWSGCRTDRHSRKSRTIGAAASSGAACVVALSCWHEWHVAVGRMGRAASRGRRRSRARHGSALTADRFRCWTPAYGRNGSATKRLSWPRPCRFGPCRGQRPGGPASAPCAGGKRASGSIRQSDWHPRNAPLRQESAETHRLRKGCAR